MQWLLDRNSRLKAAVIEANTGREAAVRGAASDLDRARQ
jgi:hypothetical protein